MARERSDEPVQVRDCPAPGARARLAPEWPEPRWIRVVAFVLAGVVLAFGLTGLLLADLGIDRPLLAFPLGTIATLGLLGAARPVLGRVDRGAVPASSHVVAAIAVAFVIGVGAWHVANASQHVFINRDGGAYADAGKWIASHGDLVVPAKTGAFAREPSLVFTSYAMFQGGGGHLTFQFAHLLPALLAAAHMIGGDSLMFALPGVLTAIGLLAFFVAASRLLRSPPLALGALVTFAFVMPEVSFGRDTYSELPTQVLLFTALWLLLDRAAYVRPRVTFLAGLFLGALQAVRIDAAALLMGLPLLFAVASLWSDDRRATARAAVACVVGALPGLVLGVADLKLRSPQYVTLLAHQLRGLGAATAAGAVAAALVVVGRSQLARVTSSRARRLALANVAAGAVALGAFAAWFLRPHVERVHDLADPIVAHFQAIAQLPVDATRTYYERSLQWMSWYLGPVTLVAAIAGGALLVRELVLRRRRASLVLVLLLGPATVLYLWKANAVSDQVWVMRRFLVSALPLLVLLAFFTVGVLLAVNARGWPRAAARVTAVAVAAIAVGWPVATTLPVAAMTEQRGYPAVVHDACRIVGPDSAVVVLADPDDYTDKWTPQTLRSWCDVPVARLPGDSVERAATLARLAREWSAAGRQLWVVAAAKGSVTAALPGAAPVATRTARNPRFLEATLFRRPRRYSTQSLTLWFAPVGPT